MGAVVTVGLGAVVTVGLGAGSGTVNDIGIIVSNVVSPRVSFGAWRSRITNTLHAVTAQSYVVLPTTRSRSKRIGLGTDASVVNVEGGIVNAGDESHKPPEMAPHLFAGSPDLAHGRGVKESLAH